MSRQGNLLCHLELILFRFNTILTSIYVYRNSHFAVDCVAAALRVYLYTNWVPSLQFWVQTHLERLISVGDFDFCNREIPVWRAVGADLGMSGFVELTLLLFIDNVGPDHSILGPDPSQTLNLVKRWRSPQTRASGVPLVPIFVFLNLFIENAVPEPSSLGPEPSQALNLVK